MEQEKTYVTSRRAPTPVVVTDVTKAYPTPQGSLLILRGVDFSSTKGLTLIMGPSGSGKSTLLYLLGGLDTPTTGIITVGNQIITTFKRAELEKYRLKTVGFVFQFHNLAMHLTALQNVMIPAMLADTSHQDAKKRAIELLTSMGLKARFNHKIYQLSSGESQRVAFATALINHPRLLLCDEPTGNLDANTAEIMIEFINEHVKNTCTTIILVSHNPIFKQIADQTLYLARGRLENNPDTV